jgi:uncharacterized peroxidase-related enzyme
MNRQADDLFGGLHVLPAVERELIAMYVSASNDCVYCQTVHGALAAHYLGGNEQIVAQVRDDFRMAPISAKLKALLTIADQVQRGGKRVRVADIKRARTQGATDLEIHDTVLIATMFCMCTGNGWAHDGVRRRLRSAGSRRPAARRKAHPEPELNGMPVRETEPVER